MKKRRGSKEDALRERTEIEAQLKKEAAMITLIVPADKTAGKKAPKGKEFRSVGRGAGTVAGAIAGSPSGPLGTLVGGAAGFLAGGHIGTKIDDYRKSKKEKETKESAFVIVPMKTAGKALSKENPGTLMATLTPSEAPKPTPAANIGAKAKIAYVIEPFPVR